MDELGNDYVEALIREIEGAADGGRVVTVFFGGGTPTQLAPGQLVRILAAVRGAFELDKEAEVTVEANPESVGEKVFEVLLEGGFNRVSVGVQSLAPHVLGKLGRVHDASKALAALRAARSAGFDNVNADLIFGTPGETPGDWRSSLGGVLDNGVDHLSAYALTIEEGTPLASWTERGEFPAPDEDDQADKYETAHEVLTEAGLVRYEISNWARPGRRCRHNLNYWKAGDYLGFGAGAHSHRAGRRWWNVKSPRTYIDKSPRVEDGFETLGRQQRIEEAAILGLRLSAGIDLKDFENKFEVSPLDKWATQINELTALGLIEHDQTTLRPSERGFLLAGHIARTLMA